MTDLLTSESIIFAIISALFAFWFPNMNALINIKMPGHIDDKKPVINDIDTILKTKVRTLLLIEIISSAIYFPDSIRILIESCKLLISEGFIVYFQNYDAVSTSYVFFCILLITLAIKTYNLRKRLVLKKIE